MKKLLKKNYIEKCQNSSIYNQIKEKLIKNLVLVDKEIINGYEKNLNIGEYFISKYLFTNIDLVNILNSMGIRSAYEDTYSIINEFNRALPIRWNDKNQRYTVEKKLEMHPVCGISWDGALMISKLFNGDLPNEIEWEIAASSGHKDYKYTWGNQSPSKEYANYEENIGRTTQVGMYNPNEIGLYDMNGNLEEWCKDNILGRQISKYERIIKGGCWYKPSNFMEIASYRARWNKLAGVGIGFRIKFNKGVIENEKGYNI